MAARKIKTDWLGARVSSDLKEEVEEYIDAAELTVGQLIRKALAEYMKSHPITEEE